LLFNLLAYLPRPPPKAYTLSLHDALPISAVGKELTRSLGPDTGDPDYVGPFRDFVAQDLVELRRGAANWLRALIQKALPDVWGADRKSTRLNSSHDQISYAVFCLKKKI